MTLGLGMTGREGVNPGREAKAVARGTSGVGYPARGFG